MKREANRSDVLDELKFIGDARNNYTVSRRIQARNLYNALYDFEFDPTEQIQTVIDILNGHSIEIPKGLKKLKQKVLK